MKSILLNKELLLPMTTHQVNEIEQENNDNLKLALGKLIVEIDFSLGTIEVRNKENRVCVNTYENEIVSIDLEEIND
jgi:hypothetical protein